MSRIRRTALALVALPVVAAGAASAADAAHRTATAGPAAPTVARPARGHVTVGAKEFSFGPNAITAKAGQLRITLQNRGHVEHELVLLKRSRPAGSLRAEHGRVSEAGSVGEISETRPGKSATHVFNLKPGNYVMVCNIPSHYGQGMHGRLTVR